MKLRITLQGTTYEVDVEVVDGGGSAEAAPAAPVARPAPVAPRPASIPPVPTPAPMPSQAGGEKACRAPIPGNIVGVKVKPGQTVAAHEAVVVLEAMKMETPINAPAAGKVKAVLVEVGQSVKQGQVLVEFE